MFSKEIRKNQKVTDQLQKEIRESNSIHQYLKKNEQELIDSSDCLSKWLGRIMDQKGLTVKDVIREVNISVPYLYRVLQGKKKPGRDMLLRILIGMRLTVQEMNQGLKMAGYKELYPRKKQDACILFALEKQLAFDEMIELLQKEGVALLDE